MNNSFDVVDAVTKEYGGTATLFAKTGDEFVRVSTNVPKPDSSGRAIGTILAGQALEPLKAAGRSMAKRRFWACPTLPAMSQ
jgi:hypothetical protein